jgi:hypothetical protein
MSLEQSVDRLSSLIEALIKQLELGRSGSPAPTPAATGKSSSGGTKNSEATASAPADTGAGLGQHAPDTSSATELDYMRDIAPRFSALVTKDRPAAIKLMQSYKPDAKKLSEIDKAHWAEALAKINALLED